MKIYTKLGDRGCTKLGTGESVHKSDIRVEAYGTVDELSSFIGLALSFLPGDSELRGELLWVQRRLFRVATLLAFPGGEAPADQNPLQDDDVVSLETAIDRLSSQMPPLDVFILPGGLKPAALLHCARSICRRAERLAAAVGLEAYPASAQTVVPFLNRLSDYLFCAARWANHEGGQSEEPAKAGS